MSIYSLISHEEHVPKADIRISIIENRIILASQALNYALWTNFH